jgi:hypothetical protein
MHPGAAMSSSGGPAFSTKAAGAAVETSLRSLLSSLPVYSMAVLLQHPAQHGARVRVVVYDQNGSGQRVTMDHVGCNAFAPSKLGWCTHHPNLAHRISSIRPRLLRGGAEIRQDRLSRGRSTALQGFRVMGAAGFEPATSRV